METYDTSCSSCCIISKALATCYDKQLPSKKKKKKKELLSIVLILFSSILKLINLFLAVLGLHCCVGSSRGEPGLPSSCSAQASHSSGFSCGGAWANKFQELWHMGSIAGPESAGSVLTPRHVGSSQNRDWTCVSCTGRWILHHWATRETLQYWF